MRSSSFRRLVRDAFVLLAVLAGCCSSARAQPSATDLDEARSQFRQGVLAGEEGRWSDALASFVRAHALSERAEVLLNVAAAQVELELFADARASYLQFRADASPEMLEAHGAGVNDALAAIDARTRAVTVVSVALSPEAQPPQPELSIPMSTPPAARRDDSALWIVLGVVGSVLVTSGAVAVGVVASGI
jgi:hypothetical protein